LQLAQRHQHKSRLQQREDEFAGDESAVDIDETLSVETHAEIAKLLPIFSKKIGCLTSVLRNKSYMRDKVSLAR